MIEKGKTYTVITKEGYFGLPAKVLSILPGDAHPYKCKVKFKDGETRIAYLSEDDLTQQPNPKGRKKKTAITDTLKQAAVADHRQKLDRKKESFEKECEEMTELAKKASKTVVEMVESGKLKVGSDEELRDAAYEMYKSMGGTSILHAYTTEGVPDSEKVVLAVEITPEAAMKNDEEEKEKEMEKAAVTVTEKVKFADVERAIDAIAYARTLGSEPVNAVLADLAVSGLKSKIVGKEIVDEDAANE